MQKKHALHCLTGRVVKTGLEYSDMYAHNSSAELTGQNKLELLGFD